MTDISEDEPQDERSRRHIRELSVQLLALKALVTVLIQTSPDVALLTEQVEQAANQLEVDANLGDSGGDVAGALRALVRPPRA